MDDYEHKYYKLKIEYATLIGQFMGVLDGLSWWQLPEGLKERLSVLKAEIRQKYDKTESMSGD